MRRRRHADRSCGGYREAHVVTTVVETPRRGVMNQRAGLARAICGAAIMSDFYAEVMKVVGPVTIGGLLGYYLRRREGEAQLRRAEVDRWNQERQSYWFPLLEAAKDFRERLVEMKANYEKQQGRPLHEWLPGDFCEVFVLERNRVDELDKNLEAADPISPRKDPGAVERTKLRIVHQLNYAASSIYKTVKYLGTAEHALRALKEGSLMLPDKDREMMRTLILDARSSLQGKGEAAGIFKEQQEAIGELVWDPDGRIITDHEFRKWVFEPGWEQFVGPFRFYAHFGKKLGSEIQDTIDALGSLVEALDRLTRGEAPSRRATPSPRRLFKPAPMPRETRHN